MFSLFVISTNNPFLSIEVKSNMLRYKRNCPKCDSVIIYKNKKYLKFAIKNNSKCSRVCLGKPKSSLHRICGKCKENKLFGEFVKNKSKRNGLTAICKTCCNETSKQYRKNNPEKVKASKEKYCKNNPEKVKKVYDRYRKNNPEKVRAKNNRWKKNNPEKVKAYKRDRRAKKLAVQENYTPEQEQITRRAFNNKCFNCESITKLHIDHHRPLSKGHPLTLQNAVVLCQSCNTSKSDKNPEDFYGKKKCDELNKILKKIALSFK